MPEPGNTSCFGGECVIVALRSVPSLTGWLARSLPEFVLTLFALVPSIQIGTRRLRRFAGSWQRVVARIRHSRFIAMWLITASVGACGGEGPTKPPANTVQSITLAQTNVTLDVGRTVQLEPVLKNATGAVVSGTVAYSSANTAVATVNTLGLVSALAPGQTLIGASSGGKSASLVVSVVSVGPRNFNVASVLFTQGVQTESSSFPMIIGGNAAAVNVYIESSQPGQTPSMQVVLNLFNATGTLTRTDTAFTVSSLFEQPDISQPAAQFLVPASAIQSGMRWQVLRDPRSLLSDLDAADDVFPRAGLATLATVSVPPLNLKLIPIRLTQHNNATHGISAAALSDFTRTLLSVHPLGAVNITITTPLSSAASFGATPRGGELTFWSPLLDELDMARTLGETDLTTHWVGVVVPPAGFNFTSFGGVGYMPFSPGSTGARSRTAALIGPGWFNNVNQSRNLLAHELGHNFARRHAPCGAATSPDAAFPNPGGLIGTAGFDVFSWSTGRAGSAALVGTGAGDVMGYCDNVWASPYTYQGVLQFRTVTTAITAEAPRKEHVVIVRGTVQAGRDVSLAPVFSTTAYATRPERSGPYVLELLNDAGRSLYKASFSPATIDHLPEIGHFTFAVPMSAELEQSIATVRVTSALGARAERRATVGATLSPLTSERPGAAPSARISRVGKGSTVLSCANATSAGILVQHAVTGRLVAVAAASSVAIAERSGTPLTVLCSDGVRTQRRQARVP